jgi:hypothetical protein
LPAAPKLLGNYTKREIEFAEAYLLLCHAEIESFLEYKANELLQKVAAHWGRTKISFSLMCLLGAIEGERKYNATQASDLAPSGKLAAAVTAAIGTHNHRIKSNNGIKENHFVNLFGPLGIRATDVTSIMLVELSTLGTRRGDIAHKSPAQRTVAITDPFAEQSKITTLVGELRDFDAKVTRVLSSLR